MLQEIYDFNFRQIELSIREIGYGDQSINKKMKDYINLFHTIIGDIHFWNKLSFDEKKKIITKFLDNFKNIKDLVVYFMDRPIVIQPLVFGLSMVLLVLFMPRGIGGWFEGVLRNRRFIKRSEEKLGGTARNS